MLKSVVVSLTVLATTTCGASGLGGSDGASSNFEQGAVNPQVTQSNINRTICKKGWTKTIRPSSSVTGKIKRQMIRKQNWKGPAILDHYIPLQGGGHPSARKNFLLQKPSESYDKDSVEDQMNDDICDGRLTLKQAQKAMSKGWKNYERNSR